MSVICPTVLADTPEEYREQIEAIAESARRIQIDLGDGRFTSRSVGPEQVWWPETIQADIHLMHERPLLALPTLIALQPHLIIVHAESSSEIMSALRTIRAAGIRAGIALLQNTDVSSVEDLIAEADHALIFSGSLGSFGGKADLSLLRKVAEIRRIKPDIEIGWDGGVNSENAQALSRGGIDVLNVGGAIQKANHPANALRALERLVNA